MIPRMFRSWPWGLAAVGALLLAVQALVEMRLGPRRDWDLRVTASAIVVVVAAANLLLIARERDDGG